jgi:2-dehydropantoate 2-reductase
MRILILGAGGTGGYFGGRLAQNGADVTFLVRPKRAALLAQKGLRLVSPDEDVTLHPKTVTADALSADGWDLVMLSCKAYDLDSSIDAIRPAVGPTTTVLPVLNGLAHYEALDRAFGRDKVLGGLCHIFSKIGPEGEIIRMAPIQRLTFGERAGGTSPRTEAFAKVCEGVVFEAVHSPNLMLAAWEKYSYLAALAAVTCLMRADVGTIMSTRDGHAIAEGLYQECLKTAEADGYLPRAEAQAEVRGMLLNPTSTQTASMLRDLEAGGATEGAHILGDMLARAQRAGIAAPLLTVANCHLQAYEERRKRAY